MALKMKWPLNGVTLNLLQKCLEFARIHTTLQEAIMERFSDVTQCE